MKRLTESIPLNTIRPSHWLFQRDCRIEIRGGGMPYSNLALNADRKNGPAARSFAADAHDRIMVRINRSYRIQVCSTKMCPNGELPSDSQQTDRHAKSPSRSSSSLRVLRRQGAAKHKLARRQAAKLLLPFRSLDPFRALREPDRRRRDEERLFRSEQRTDYKPKLRLDSKSPIQVRIHLPPAVSQRTAVPHL